MKITSPVFAEGSTIPESYSKYGANEIPPLDFDGVPEQAASLALIVDDPDAPRGTFNHWLVYNLDPKTRHVGADGIPRPAAEGKNDFGETGYGGPQPPSGEHRYFFKLYALDSMLPLADGASRKQMDRAMKNHVMENAVLMGRYTHEKE